MRVTYLEDFHEPCDIKLGVERKVVNVGDEVCDLFLKEMEMFLNIIQGVFITVDNALVIVIRPLVCIIAMLFLGLSIVGSTTRRAVRMARAVSVSLGSELSLLFD